MPENQKSRNTFPSPARNFAPFAQAKFKSFKSGPHENRQPKMSQKKDSREQPGRDSNTPAKTSLHEFCLLLAAQDETATRKPAADSSPLVRNLFLTACRQRPALDWILEQQANGKLKQRLRRVLYWALIQHFCLNGLPLPVIADLATAYVKKHFSTPEAGFVNAVLRHIGQMPPETTLDSLLAKAPLNVQFRLPECLFKRWQSTWHDDELLKSVSQVLLSAPPAVFRLRQYASQPLNQVLPEGLEELPALPWTIGQRLFTAVSHDLESDLLHRLSEEDQPQFYVQDPSTLLAPFLLQARPGECLADLCAAPGGKSVLLAEAMQGQGKLLCADRSESRLRTLRQNLRYFSNLEIKAADATNPGLPPESLDGLLLDVPCSNTGVIRRAPDVRFRFSEANLRELTALQANILESCAKLIRPGGRLVYSTCSLEPEENTRQVHEFLARHREFSLDCEQQLYPTSSHDGGFAARLNRTAQ